MYNFSDIYKIPVMSFMEENDPNGGGIGAPWSMSEEDPFDPYRGGMGIPQVIDPSTPVAPPPGSTSWGTMACGLFGGLVVVVGFAWGAYCCWARRRQGVSGKLSGLLDVYNLYYF